MKRYERDVSEKGTITFSAPSGYHDDCVIALALANRHRQEYHHTGTMVAFPRHRLRISALS